MRDLQLWHNEVPPAEALASAQPFAIDSLTFTQWLQFLFIPRLQHLVAVDGDLPVNCNVAPMAEEYFGTLNIQATSLITQLRRMDQLLSQ